MSLERSLPYINKDVLLFGSKKKQPNISCSKFADTSTSLSIEHCGRSAARCDCMVAQDGLQ